MCVLVPLAVSTPPSLNLYSATLYELRSNTAADKKREETTYGWDTISCLTKRADSESEASIADEKREETTNGWDTISCLTKRADLERKADDEVPEKKRDDNTYGWDTISCLTKRSDLERET